MFGSQHNDAIGMEGKTSSNHAGGIVGGISNNNRLVFRIAIKPTASTPKQQPVLTETGNMEDFSNQRAATIFALRCTSYPRDATAVAFGRHATRTTHSACLEINIYPRFIC